MRSKLDIWHEAVRALNAGDVEAAAALCTDDCEFFPLRASITGPFIGPDGFRAFWRDTQETFDVFQVSYPDEQQLDDGRVLAIGDFTTRGRGSEVETQAITAILISFREARSRTSAITGTRQPREQPPASKGA